MKRFLYPVTLRLLNLSLLSLVFMLFGVRGNLGEARQNFNTRPATEVRQAIARAGSYLARICDADGKFVYRVNLNPEIFMQPGYNMLRHAGTMYALAMYEQFSPNAKTRDVLKRAAKFLQQSINPLPSEPSLLAVWSFPKITGSDKPVQVKLGGTGLGLVALLSVEQLLPETISREDARKLGQFLVFMQKEDGSFYSKYFPYGKGRDDSWTSLYYPGEAALGLLLLYEYDPDPLWLRTAIDTIMYLVRTREGRILVEADHWILLATAKLLELMGESQHAFPKEAILKHGIQICLSMLMEKHPFPDTVPEHGCFSYDGRTTPTAIRLEGLLAALTFLPPEETALRERITAAIQHGISFLLRTQIQEGAHAGGIPRAIRLLSEAHPRFSSSFNKRATEIRIDYVQHALSAMIQSHREFLQ